MNDIIEHFQNKGYIFYDLANLTSFYNYFKYIIYKLWNYKKLIIYLNYSFNDNNDNNTFFYKLYIKLLLIYINLIYNPNIKNYYNKTIFFFPYEKICIINKPVKTDNKLLSDMNKILLNKYYDCNICFNDKHTQIFICNQCNFQTCYKCNKKIKMISNSCCCCKYTYKN
jgi:hypothetical protein